jgi:hypothetical protein
MGLFQVSYQTMKGTSFMTCLKKIIVFSNHFVRKKLSFHKHPCRSLGTVNQMCDHSGEIKYDESIPIEDIVF